MTSVLLPSINFGTMAKHIILALILALTALSTQAQCLISLSDLEKCRVLPDTALSSFMKAKKFYMLKNDTSSSKGIAYRGLSYKCYFAQSQLIRITNSTGKNASVRFTTQNQAWFDSLETVLPAQGYISIGEKKEKEGDGIATIEYYSKPPYIVKRFAFLQDKKKRYGVYMVEL